MGGEQEKEGKFQGEERILGREETQGCKKGSHIRKTKGVFWCSYEKGKKNARGKITCLGRE